MTSTATIDAAGSAKATLLASLEAAATHDWPYRHWIARNVFPASVSDMLRRLPIPAFGVDGVSGKRELHNDRRRYFDAANIARFPACAAVAEAFRSAEVVRAVERITGADLYDAYVRLEYAQDVDGFWLEPHTDLGVKLFTMLIYLNDGGDNQSGLGTDMFADNETFAKSAPFEDNTALIFVPGDNTWHGLRRRPIRGVRRSVIMNYVTDDWRAREQLAGPAAAV